MGNKSRRRSDNRSVQQSGRSFEDEEAARLESHDIAMEESNADDDDDDDDDEETNEDERETSCCGGIATCCNPWLRDASVNEPISSCLCQCLTWSSLFWLGTIISMITMTWVTLYFLIGDEMASGGRVFGLFFLVIASYTLGWTLAYIPLLNLPPVFGMLLAGIIFRNTGIYDINEKIGIVPTAKIRTFCLTFIMLRAGLQLSTTALRRHPIFMIVLALLPCSMEMLVVSVSSRYILDYPWDWSFLTGSIVACMSPVVTVNCILALADRGYGEDKGMATLLCTATSIDDVHIVSLFSICFSIVFRDDTVQTKWYAYIPSGIRDILLGLMAGLVLGTIFVFVPHRTAKYVTWYRLGSLVLGSLMCTTVATTLFITGGGYLATLFMSFIATAGWRLLSPSKFDVTPLRKAAFFMWHFMQPILVGVIGADIDFALWSTSRFGLYVLCILIGLLGRSIFAILSTYGTPFDIKERIFVALAWLPKGTLQAALAPMAYEQAKSDNDPTKIKLAADIVRISVVSIIFLAPLGAIIMTMSGPLLLNKITEEEARRHRHLSFLRMASQLQPVRGLRKRRARKIRRDADTAKDPNELQQPRTSGIKNEAAV